MSNPIVTITMASGNAIKVELYPEMAPNTVNNFIFLINNGFYDGLGFHRIIPGFMIQGGCPQGNGMGGPGYTIEGEFAENGFKDNTLLHERGVISMARTMHPDSAGSQFFIMHDQSNRRNIWQRLSTAQKILKCKERTVTKNFFLMVLFLSKFIKLAIVSRS